MKTGIIIAVVVVLLVAGAGIYYFNSINNSGSNNTSTPPAANNSSTNVSTTTAQNTAPAPAAPASNAPAAPSPKAVSIANFSFSPSALTVKTGTKVTWTNNDSVTHTVTSDSGLFDSGPLSPGRSFSFTFRSPGTINYHCSIHPMMKGSVTVQN